MDNLIRRRNSWEAYINALSSQNQIEIKRLFQQVQSHISLPANENELLIKNYRDVILSYNSMGLPVNEIVKRLSASNLGSYYREDHSDRWYPLDNAAKLQPLAMSANWMSVFRLTAVLTENVVPEILQMALTYTVKRFPYFAVNIK